jgi:hypothetical protein
MKNSISILPILLLLVSGCNKDPDPDPSLPDPIRSYMILYNFLTEPFHVSWETDGSVIQATHPYGVPVLGYVTLESNSQEVNFEVKEAGTSQVIQSDLYEMEKDQYYIVAILGNADKPYILFEPVNMDLPSPDKIRVRFLQAVPDLEPIDIYIGGYTADYRVTSGVTFTDITEYVEVTEEDAWHSLTIAPYEILPSDSSIYTFTQNEVFEPDRVYLGVIAHLNSSPASDVQLLLYDQPMEP